MTAHPLRIPEILLHIFSFILTSTIVIPPEPDDPRLILISVCGQWRDLILSSPSLWSAYRFTARSFRCRDALLRLFHTWAARSGSVGLSFSFNTDYYVQALDNRNDEPFGRVPTWALGVRPIDFIHPYANRLKYLHVILSVRLNTPQLLDILHLHFPKLSTFSLTLANDSHASTSSFTLRASRPSSLLPVIMNNIFRMTNGVHPILCNFAWAFVTQAHFGNITIDPYRFLDFMYEARHCLREAHFTIGFHLDYTPPRNGVDFRLGAPIVMPSLRQLNIFLIHQTLWTNFISRIRLPIVEHLQVERFEGTHPFNWEVPSYIELLSNSRGGLQSLHFYPRPVRGEEFSLVHDMSFIWRASSDEIRQLLVTVPNLHTLTLPTGVQLHPQLLEDIAQEILLPELSGLQLATDTDGHLLFDMLQRRPSIQSIEFVLPTTDALAVSHLWREVKLLQTLGRRCELSFMPPCPKCNRCCALGE
ncbi:hypothetical protein CVT26_013278 [Gymnopilus dilepis]|uniref:Uncharacterized protein n=1 Tax=Gymnopilus dilepis TaxID=231916 RepID=A0A409VUR0_9AGAR|nr:hypothetical protein CVT26_013278 [Gymnopilus dilepis]